jgi:hypothetical protein
MRGNGFLSIQNRKDGTGGAHELVMKFLVERGKECVVVAAEMKGPNYLIKSFLL